MTKATEAPQVAAASIPINLPNDRDARITATIAAQHRHIESGSGMRNKFHNTSFGRAALPEEIEIAALIRLVYVLKKHPAVPPLVVRWRFFAGRQPTFDLFRRNVESEIATFSVKVDLVSGFHNRQRATHRRLGSHMQYNCAETGAAHPGIADADNIAHSAIEEHAGHGNLTPFGETGRSFGAVYYT